MIPFFAYHVERKNKKMTFPSSSFFVEWLCFCLSSLNSPLQNGPVQSQSHEFIHSYRQRRPHPSCRLDRPQLCCQFVSCPFHLVSLKPPRWTITHLPILQFLSTHVQLSISWVGDPPPSKFHHECTNCIHPPSNPSSYSQAFFLM